MIEQLACAILFIMERENYTEREWKMLLRGAVILDEAYDTRAKFKQLILGNAWIELGNKRWTDREPYATGR